MSAPDSSAAPARAPRPTPLQRVLQVFLVLSLPVLWLAVGVRLVATPAFLWLEYHRPGFPADPWGMGLNERMTFGSYGLDYIMNLAPPEYLGGLVSPGGGLAFTPSEVSHMTDVQHVMQWGLLLAAVLLVLSALAGWYLHRTAPGTATAAWFWGPGSPWPCSWWPRPPLCWAGSSSSRRSTRCSSAPERGRSASWTP